MIHPAFSIFLLLSVAHLAADFALQPGALVAWKGRSWTGAFFHAGVFALAAFLLSWATGTLPVLCPWILLLWAVHAFADRRKISLQRQAAPAKGSGKRAKQGFWFFLVDQALHYLALALASIFAVLTGPRVWPRLPADHSLLIINVYLLVVFAGTVALAVYAWEVRGAERKGIPAADWLIGGWERGLLLTAVLFWPYWWLAPLAILPRLLAFRQDWPRPAGRTGLVAALGGTVLLGWLLGR